MRQDKFEPGDLVTWADESLACQKRREEFGDGPFMVLKVDRLGIIVKFLPGRWTGNYFKKKKFPKEIELEKVLKMLLSQYKLHVGPDDAIANCVISEVEKVLKS